MFLDTELFFAKALLYLPHNTFSVPPTHSVPTNPYTYIHTNVDLSLTCAHDLQGYGPVKGRKPVRPTESRRGGRAAQGAEDARAAGE